MKLRKIYSFLITVATMLLAALFCSEVISIYLEGNAPENLSNSGVYLRDVFSPDIIAAHLARIQWSFWAWAGLVIMSCFLPFRFQDTPHPMHTQPMQTASSPRRLRGALYLAALALLVWGVLNGGLYDVFVKATHICTECIGLG